MEIRDVSDKLLQLYRELGVAFSAGQARSGLPCLPGCGQCCLSPEVEATMIEMFPMALKLVREGRAEKVLQLLTETQPTSCWAYQRHSPDGSKGQCGEYETRPTICREFGVAGAKDKQGRPRLSVCKLIRAADPAAALSAETSLSEWGPPLMEDWTMRLLQIHPLVLTDPKPINQSLRQALETILFYESLRGQEASEG